MLIDRPEIGANLLVRIVSFAVKAGMHSIQYKLVLGQT